MTLEKIETAGKTSIDKKGSTASGDNVFLLGTTSLLNDVSSEMIQPVMPLFIASLGGGGLAVGLIGGLSEGIPSVLKVLSGYWSDRLGKRKPLVVAGYGLSALAKLFFPQAAVWQHVFLLKTLERCGKGIRSAPRDGIVADSAPTGTRGKGFGILRAMDTTGAVLGSAMAYLLWRWGMDFRAILVVAALVALLSFVPLLRVRDTVRAPAPRMELTLSSMSPGLRRFVVVASVFALANFSYMFFILRAQELFSGQVGAPLLLYIIFNVVYAALAVPSGIISDRLGRKAMLSFGYALFALVALGFAYITSVLGLVILFVLYGLVFAVVDGAERAFISDMSCAAARCTSLGVYHGAVGTAAIASGIVAGSLWEGIGHEATFLFGAAAATLAFLGLLQSG